MGNSLKLLGGAFLFSWFAASPAFSSGTTSSELESLQIRLDVPENVARITDAYLPASGPRNPQRNSSSLIPEYILIQDVHRHPQVQSHIAYLIVHAYDHWGVKKTFMEGAFTPVDLSIFHRVPRNTQSLLMRRLVKDGNLSGPEIAAVLIMEREWRNPPVSPFQLFGMEDPTLYRQNIFAYESVIAHRDEALQNVAFIHQLQMSIHLPDYNPLVKELKRVDDLVRLKLTPSEYNEYLNAKDLSPSSLALTPAVQAAEEFYRLAQLRSAYFLKAVHEKVPASISPRIVVVGGFHTAEMAAQLRQENHSFIVLSPVISVAGGEPLYERRMQETVDVLTEALPHSTH